PCDALPAASRARHETVVIPTANCDPDGGVQATETAPETASAALAANVTTALSVMSPLAVTGPGNVSAGGVVSWTVTETDADPALPAASVAVQVTRLSPIGKTAPETTGVGRPRPVVIRHTGVRLPLTRSRPLAANVTGAPVGPLASTESGPGTVTTGADWSTTWTTNWPSASWLVPAAAVHATTVSPSGRCDPDGGVQVMASGLFEMSVAEGAGL